MKTFKEFSLNIAPKGHKIVKVLDTKGGEVMITKKGDTFHIMYDNQTVDTEDNQREAMKSARNFGQMMSKGGLGGASSSKLGGKRIGQGGIFK